MSDHPRIPYADAFKLANQLIAELAPACERIAIAGSLRRQRPDVGDVELVAIPRTTQPTDLFGDPAGLPISELDALLADLDVQWHKNGPAYKQFVYRGAVVDLFVVTPATWGVQFLIRTGGEEFSHWMVTSQAVGGALPFGYQIKDGRLWHLGQPVPTPEESDVFNAIKLPYIPPEERSGHGWFKRSGQP